MYEEIVFLQNYFEGIFIVENVIPYYKPLLNPQKISRHLFWCNFNLKLCSYRDFTMKGEPNEFERLCEFHDYDFNKYRQSLGVQKKIKIARNLVDYQLGENIFPQCIAYYNSKLFEQKKIQF